MPRDGAGNYTLPAGNPVLSGTIITPTWANPTMSDLGNEMTDSLSRTGKGGMLVPFLNQDGSESNPGITWTNEANTGFYRNASADMRATVSSTDSTRWISGFEGFEIWTSLGWQRPILPSTDPVVAAGQWLFESTVGFAVSPILFNNQFILGVNTVATNRNLIGISDGDVIQVGDVNNVTQFLASAYLFENASALITGGWLFDGSVRPQFAQGLSLIAGEAIRGFDTGDSPIPMLFMDSGNVITHGNPAYPSQAFGEWVFLGRVDATAQIRLFNNIPLRGVEVGSTIRDMLYMSTSDEIRVGNASNTSRYDASNALDIYMSNLRVAAFRPTASGSLLINDLGGVLKKAGFRNPTFTAVSSNRSATQDDEGQYLELGNGVAFTLDTLEANTTLRIQSSLSSGGTGSIIAGAGINIFLVDGDSTGLPVSSLDLTAGALVEIYYATSGSIRAFGVGITGVP